MDYLDHVPIDRHVSFAAFEDWRARAGRRLVLLTTKGAVDYLDFAYRPGDILLVGRESAGVPDGVHEAADARVVIPIRPGFRSLNVAVAGTMVLGEALRQVSDLKPKELLERRYDRINSYGRFSDTKAGK